LRRALIAESCNTATLSTVCGSKNWEKHLSQDSDETVEIEPGSVRDRLLAAVARDVTRLTGEVLTPGLYLVATPIGNLGDITLRALSVLIRADIVYCEDTRHSAKLLGHYSIHATTRPLHDHNEDSERSRVLRDLEAGKRIALISDAGTPLISDPGFKLVRDCAAAGHAVISIPGPSSVISAISASGLPTDAFFFAGFLPPKQAARRARLSELKLVPGSLIFFESPQRAADSLADMAELLGERDAVMARELTKMHEELARGPLQALAESVKTRELKGEIVLVVGPSTAAEATDDDIAARLDVALQSMSLKDAAKAVSDALGVAKTRVYDLGLKSKQRG
jgi:16S rRNA (cytidine1402-2'-O)-methyltransferase